MFLSKIRQRESGILVYGICPPKVHTPLDKVVKSADRLASDLATIDIDALIVYDVQDESARTSEERPFPYVSSLDPLEYSSQYLRAVNVPKIIYRPAGMFSRDELQTWLSDVARINAYPVFVGVPAPDYVPKTSLAEAYALWRDAHASESVIGAVTIPERHAVLRDEQFRILDKVSNGVSFFVSQCIFHIEYVVRMLDDLVAKCREEKHEIPTMIFTLTICGSAKTLQFLEWLGITVPEPIRQELCAADNPVECSVRIASEIASQLIECCRERSIPFGFNVESVAIRREEIEASHQLVRIIHRLLVDSGIRISVSENETLPPPRTAVL